MCQTCETVSPRQIAHRWEIPLVRLGVVATLGALVLGVGALAMMDEKILDEHPWLLSGPMVIALVPVMYVTRYFMAAKQRANSARIGPDQFPDVWAIYSDLLQRFALPYDPALYIQNGNGVVNAFAFSCSRGRNYVVLNSEIAVLARDFPDIVRFVLAHELAHHKLGHVRLRRLAVSAILDLMYLPGKALSRAQEYSADRLALAMCPDTANALMILSVGPWLATQGSPDAFYQQAIDEKAGLMIRVVNAMQTHPVFTKRFHALKSIETGGFKNHGALF